MEESIGLILITETIKNSIQNVNKTNITQIE